MRRPNSEWFYVKRVQMQDYGVFHGVLARLGISYNWHCRNCGEEGGALPLGLPRLWTTGKPIVLGPLGDLWLQGGGSAILRKRHELALKI